MAIRVLIVGDIKLYREGLERMLRNITSILVVGTATGPLEASQQVETQKPDVVLLDMATADAHAAVRDLRQVAPDLKVVAMTVPELQSEVIACAEAGVAGYVTRGASVSDVIQSIESAALGELRCSARIAGSLLRRLSTLAAERHSIRPVESLTPRECHVLEHVDQGLSNKEIACELGIEVSTVKNHVHHILEKLGVQRRAQAAAVMRRAQISRSYEPSSGHMDQRI